MRALWIEDDQLVGDSLEMLLQVVVPEITLDKARDLASGLRLVRTFQYELVLLDWCLGSTDGETAIVELRATGRPTPIIVVSGAKEELVMKRAFALGATAYVPKSDPPAKLVEAIRNTVRIEAISRSPASGLLSSRLEVVNGGPADAFQTAFPELTARQADVFRELMRGLSDKQIARELCISDTTVKSHVRAILQIVGVHKRGEATFEARARGVSDR